MSIIQKSLSSEKSFNNQDKGVYTFLVPVKTSKSQIKTAVESLFGEKIASVNTCIRPAKIRNLQGSRFHSRRQSLKVARVTLQDKKKKLDLTKVKK